jgi:multidrug efflux pump subunit AcrA (membrane-fusion protein)
MTTSNTADLSKLRIDRQRESPPNSGRVNRKHAILFTGIAIAAVAVFVLFSRGALSSDVEVQTFTVTAISPAQAEAVLTASGYVVAQRQAAVASKATGRLEYLGVEEGDQVKAGQIIARLESNDVAAALAQAQANLAAAKARLPQSQADRNPTFNGSNPASRARLCSMPIPTRAILAPSVKSCRPPIAPKRR